MKNVICAVEIKIFQNYVVYKYQPKEVKYVIYSKFGVFAWKM